MTERGLLLPLICNGCGRELAGGPNALVYVCLECGEATHMGDPGVVYRVVHVRAGPAFSGPRVYAPFWRLAGRVTLLVDDEKKRRVYQNVKPLGPLFFPAFWSPKAAYVDDLTLRYAGAQDRIELQESQEPVLDGVRDPRTLPEMARLTWLAYLDRFADVSGLEVEFQVESVTYAAVPFFTAQGGFRDGVLGIQLPAGYFSGHGLSPGAGRGRLP